MANAKLLCGIGCSICALIVVLVVLLVSIGTVEPIEYGLKYNSISKKTDNDNVYSGGWYMIGPFNSFLSFPATLVNADYSNYPDAQMAPIVGGKDGSGQAMILSLSFQYKLVEKNVGNLYSAYQTNYEKRFMSWASAEVVTTVGLFTDNTMLWT